MKHPALAYVAALLSVLLICIGCSTSPEQQSLDAIAQIGGKIKTDAEGRVVEVDLSRTKATDSDLGYLSAFPHIQSLNCSDTQITTLDTLPVLAEIHTLFLSGTKITDEGLAHVGGLTSLHTLHLGRTQITDAGLQALKNMTHLRTLALGDTAITDAGLGALRNLRELSTLVLRHTKVTPAGVQALRRSLPDTPASTARGNEPLMAALPRIAAARPASKSVPVRHGSHEQPQRCKTTQKTGSDIRKRNDSLAASQQKHGVDAKRRERGKAAEDARKQKDARVRGKPTLSLNQACDQTGGDTARHVDQESAQREPPVGGMVQDESAELVASNGTQKAAESDEQNLPHDPNLPLRVRGTTHQ